MGHNDYTSLEVAALCGLSLPRIRSLARAGVVGTKSKGYEGPRAPWRFSFRDLRVLRTARALVGSGLNESQMQRTLTSLKSQVERRAVPLSGANLVKDRGRILARDGRTMWDTESGQTLLWYEPTDASATPLGTFEPSPTHAKRVHRLPDHGGTAAADAHFIEALALEARDVEAAYHGYRQALACDPAHVEATINVGRLCSADGDYERAVAYFTVATRLDPEHAIAQFNLAVTLHDLGRLKEAEVAYRHALILDPDCQDARINLRLLMQDETLG